MNKLFYYTVMAIIVGVSGYFIQKNWKQSSANLEKAKIEEHSPGGKGKPPMMQKGAEFKQEELISFMDKLGEFSEEEKKNVIGYFFGLGTINKEALKLQSSKSLTDGKALNHALLKSALLGSEKEFVLSGQLMIESAGIIPKMEDKKVFLNLAAIEFKKEIKKNPNNLNVRNYLASSLMDISEANIFESLALLRGTLKIDKDNYNAHYILGELSLKSNQLKKAVVRFKKCLSLQPEKPDAYMQLSKVYLLMKAQDSAVYFRNEGMKKIKPGKNK